jgi:hypothetical protein
MSAAEGSEVIVRLARLASAFSIVEVCLAPLVAVEALLVLDDGAGGGLEDGNVVVWRVDAPE